MGPNPGLVVDQNIVGRTLACGLFPEVTPWDGDWHCFSFLWCKVFSLALHHPLVSSHEPTGTLSACVIKRKDGREQLILGLNSSSHWVEFIECFKLWSRFDLLVCRFIDSRPLQRFSWFLHLKSEPATSAITGLQSPRSNLSGADPDPHEAYMTSVIFMMQLNFVWLHLCNCLHFIKNCFVWSHSVRCVCVNTHFTGKVSKSGILSMESQFSKSRFWSLLNVIKLVVMDH